MLHFLRFLRFLAGESNLGIERSKLGYEDMILDDVYLSDLRRMYVRKILYQHRHFSIWK